MELVPSPSRSPASFGRGGVPEPGKALKLPSCAVVGWSGSPDHPHLAVGIPRGRGVWHWGAAKDQFLADAEPPAMSDSSAGSGSEPVGQGELCAQSRMCLCIVGGCFSHGMSSTTSAEVGCGVLGRMAWPVYVQGGC